MWLNDKFISEFNISAASSIYLAWYLNIFNIESNMKYEYFFYDLEVKIDDIHGNKLYFMRNYFAQKIVF